MSAPTDKSLLRLFFSKDGLALTHVYDIRVYYADTDAGGVVYHATYLAMAERARTEALRDSGRPHARMLAEHDCQFMVRRVNLEYLRPARLDDMLTIRTSLLARTPATLTLDQVFSAAGGETLARLVVQLVCVGATSFRPVRIPAGWGGELTQTVSADHSRS